MKSLLFRWLRISCKCMTWVNHLIHSKYCWNYWNFWNIAANRTAVFFNSSNFFCGFLRWSFIHGLHNFGNTYSISFLSMLDFSTYFLKRLIFIRRILRDFEMIGQSPNSERCSCIASECPFVSSGLQFSVNECWRTPAAECCWWWLGPASWMSANADCWWTVKIKKY